MGYLDVTHCFDKNEPYDLWVKDAFKDHGVEADLLARALEHNQPRSMMALVDEENEGQILLYESVGFQRMKGQNSITAHLKT